MAEFNPFGQLLQSRMASDQFNQQKQQNAFARDLQTQQLGLQKKRFALDQQNALRQQEQMAAEDARKMFSIFGPMSAKLMDMPRTQFDAVAPGVVQHAAQMFPNAGLERLQSTDDIYREVTNLGQAWKATQQPEEVEYQLVQNERGEYVRIPKTPGADVSPTGVRGELGKGKTEITITEQPPTALNKKFLETISANEANNLQQLTEKARAASESRYSLQSQRAIIEQGLETGKVQPLLQGVSALAEGLGVNPELLNLPDPSLGQAFNQASFDQLLKTLQAQKGPQTEGDAERARKTFAGLGNTKEANLFIIEYLEELANRQEMMADYVDRVSTTKYMDEVRPVSKAESDFRKWARKHPVVATSPTKKIPITYSQYKQAAMDIGMTEEQANEEWQAFAGVK